MTNTLDSSPEQIPLSFADPRGTAAMFGERDGIWSCRFSADGNEVVAGGNTKIYGVHFSRTRRGRILR
jgi:WD repeat-containing protein 23